MTLVKSTGGIARQGERVSHWRLQADAEGEEKAGAHGHQERLIMVIYIYGTNIW